jgi:hypothetical protein
MCVISLCKVDSLALFISSAQHQHPTKYETACMEFLDIPIVCFKTGNPGKVITDGLVLTHIKQHALKHPAQRK